MLQLKALQKCMVQQPSLTHIMQLRKTNGRKQLQLKIAAKTKHQKSVHSVALALSSTRVKTACMRQ